MDELDVIVDVRQIPNSLDLLIVRQKVSAEGGKIHLVGTPSETRIMQSIRKVNVTLSLTANWQIGCVLVAHIKNVGFTLLDEMSVHFEYQRTPSVELVPDLEAEPAMGELSRKFGFIQANRKHNGPIVPGETRDWYLPADFVEMATRIALTNTPDKYSIVVEIGNEEIARIPGQEVGAFLQAPGSARRVNLDRRVKAVLESLSQEDRLKANQIIDSLQTDDQSVEFATTIPGRKDLYVFVISPQLSMLVRTNEGKNHFEIIDIISSDVLQDAP